jgi:hypothetical protein
MVPGNVDAHHEIFVTGSPWTIGREVRIIMKLEYWPVVGPMFPCFVRNSKIQLNTSWKKNIKFYKWKFQKKFSQEKNTIRTSVADQDPGSGMIDQDHISQGLETSDPDPWHFCVDPDPQIHASEDPDPDHGFRSCYFHHWPSISQQKTNFFTKFFLLVTFLGYIYIIFQR